MKKAKKLIVPAVFALLLVLLLTLSGCGKTGKVSFSSMPADTDLEYWVTDKIPDGFADDHEIIPGWFGADEYYGKDYHTEKNADGSFEYLASCVKYLVTGYPDTLDPHVYITSVTVSDPAVRVAGFRVGMSEEEFYSAFEKIGYSRDDSDSFAPSVTDGLVTVTLYENSLSIGVPVTNVNNVVY